MSKRNRKNGFSLAEAVIALAVITLVTVAALSMSFSAVLARMNIVNRSYAQGFAADILECFKAATTEEEFIALVEFSTDAGLSDGDEYDNIGNYSYTSDEHQFTAKIDIYNDATNNNRRTLTVTVTENDDDSAEIITLNYAKGS